MNYASELTFIAWTLVVQIGGGQLEIPFASYGPFNSQECVKWETHYRRQGLDAKCEAEIEK